MVAALLVVVLVFLAAASLVLLVGCAQRDDAVTAKRFTPAHVDRHLDCTPHVYADGRRVTLCDWQGIPVADRYQVRVDGRWLAVSERAYTQAHIGSPLP